MLADKYFFLVNCNIYEMYVKENKNERMLKM